MTNEEIIQIYSKAIQFAQQTEQTVGEKNDYYVTIEQLERLLQSV